MFKLVKEHNMGTLPRKAENLTSLQNSYLINEHLWIIVEDHFLSRIHVLHFLKLQ